MRQNVIGNLPTVQAPTVIQHVYVPVPYPVAAPDTGGGMAVASLIFGIISASFGWIPFCGVMALFPAILGIVFGGLGMKSRRRWHGRGRHDFVHAGYRHGLCVLHLAGTSIAS